VSVLGRALAQSVLMSASDMWVHDPTLQMGENNPSPPHTLTYILDCGAEE